MLRFVLVKLAETLLVPAAREKSTSAVVALHPNKNYFSERINIIFIMHCQVKFAFT